MSEEHTFDKSKLPEEIVAREYSKDGFLDDYEAYSETADKENLIQLRQQLVAVSKWRPAKSTAKLRDQINAAFPNRSKASDGTIGDSSHCPGTSDHCANIIDNGVGVVTAIDITHDPANGCDMGDVTRAISGDKDQRIKYIIYNSEICRSYDKPGKPAWSWNPYTGSNPHKKHAHFSVLSEKLKYDNTDNWKIS